MRSKKFVFFILLGLLFLLLGIFIYFIWKWKNYVTTDAVFVQADRLVFVSFPKVNGRIIKLTKKEGDKVLEGEVLAEIEPIDYWAKVRNLEEEIKRVSSEIETITFSKEKLGREILLRSEQIEREINQLDEQKRAQREKIEALKARLSFIKKDRRRLEALYKEGLIALQSLEAKETEERELLHQIEGEEANLKALIEKRKALQRALDLVQNEKITLKELEAKRIALSYQVKSLEAQKEEAKFYYSYTQLKSPISGLIAKKFRSEGDVIAPGEPIYSIVDPQSFYILVLLEETKLHGVKKGAPVKIKLDAYPGEEWRGEVEEILPATAATFALVPRDISAGEFTKLAQRIPVKIKIVAGDRSLLRVGLGGEVEIKRVK
ncbi:MAG: HlyD family secretion protein [Caldimicrobium sp.]